MNKRPEKYSRYTVYKSIQKPLLNSRVLFSEHLGQKEGIRGTGLSTLRKERLVKLDRCLILIQNKTPKVNLINQASNFSWQPESSNICPILNQYRTRKPSNILGLVNIVSKTFNNDTVLTIASS